MRMSENIIAVNVAFMEKSLLELASIVKMKIGKKSC